jgi:uncharacterized membrane protein
MWGPCGAGMWGFWWIFPLIGAVVCLALIVLAVRFMSTGRGLSCMGGHGHTGSDHTAELRRELGTLREEVERLKPTG